MPGTPPLGPAALPRVRRSDAPRSPVRPEPSSSRSPSRPRPRSPPSRRARRPPPPARRPPRRSARRRRRRSRPRSSASSTPSARRTASCRSAVPLRSRSPPSATRPTWSTRRYFAHVSPSGGTVDKRARRAGLPHRAVLGRWARTSAGRRRRPRAPRPSSQRGWRAPSTASVILDVEFRDAGIGLVARLPTGDAGATFALELGAIVPCVPAGGAGGTVRAAPRARVGTS